VSNDELLGQLRDEEGGYEVVDNDVQNHSEHNQRDMEDDTQLIEKEYEEQSDFNDEYISNDDDFNISDDHEFYEQDDDDEEWSLYFSFGDSLINVSKYVIVLINMCFYYVTNILMTLSLPWFTFIYICNLFLTFFLSYI